MDGSIVLLDIVNKDDFGGGHICYTEIMAKNDTIQSEIRNYTLLISLCQDGFGYLVFNILYESIQNK